MRSYDSATLWKTPATRSVFSASEMPSSNPKCVVDLAALLLLLLLLLLILLLVDDAGGCGGGDGGGDVVEAVVELVVVE